MTSLLSASCVGMQSSTKSQKDFWKDFQYKPQKASELYSQNCLMCHGSKGDGKGPAHKAINPPPRDFTKAIYKYGSIKEPEKLYLLIQDGKGSMPAWKHLPENDIKQLLKYIINFSQEQQ